MATKSSPHPCLSRSHKVNANIIHIIFTDMSTICSFHQIHVLFAMEEEHFLSFVFFGPGKHSFHGLYVYSEANKEGVFQKWL